MRHTISTANDLSVAIAPTSHLGVLVPVPMAWAPGALAGTHRLAARVRHRGAAIVQQGHDVGPGVVHGMSPPDPFAAAKHMLASRRTVVVGFARVRVGGAPIACVGVAAAMSCCAEPVDLPVGDAPTNRLNAVCVGSGDVGSSGPARIDDPSRGGGRWGTPLGGGPAGQSPPPPTDSSFASGGASAPPVIPTRAIIA